MTHLNEGDKAPDFQFVNELGETKGLIDLMGKKTVLFFYPKDNTPGCTAEACNLRDNYQEFIDSGYQIVGVSPDSEKSHQKFKTKYNLPFPLIPDTEKQILTDYGVWGEKKMYGRTYMGVHRMTFIIDESGNIEKIFNKVKTKDHTNQILGNIK